MTYDDTFRLILFGIFGALLPFALYHRIRSLSKEKLDRWQEGAFILFGLRLSGLPWVIGWLAWMIAPSTMSWSSLPIPLWLRWSGLILIVFGGILFVWTFQTLGRNLTDTVVTRKDHTLVTTGPYQYVRHPFYSAFFVGVFGIGIVASNWFLLLSSLIPTAFLVARTSIEEAKLIEKFGEDYRNYMARTGRFWPSNRL